ncbi:MAG: ABC transporter permease [Chlamydiales bacterium]
MIEYIFRRLLLLPLTLFAIILVNFVILNLAPGDPVNIAHLSSTGDAIRAADETGVTGENRYLQFREHYGLTLPLLFNRWPSLSTKKIQKGLAQLAAKENEKGYAYQQFLTLWGDRARFIMPHLLNEAKNPKNTPQIQRIASNLFIRGGIRQGHVGATLTLKQRKENYQISKSNFHLSSLRLLESDSIAMIEAKVSQLITWFEEQKEQIAFTWPRKEKLKILFFKTRFFRYLSRVLRLDFGTLRNDSNKTVISEVAKRLKYSLTLAFIPMVITFFCCQIFGMLMAAKQNRWPDYSLNIFFLSLYAIPVFIVAPFLIQNFALHKTIPFTHVPIPYSGFHSQAEIYDTYNSLQRLADITLHLFLPLIAIMYGTFAMQARLSRTAFLEVLRQDYIRTARAKGLPWKTILVKHVGRNGAITIVTSLAASLGIVLGGSLIVETIFEINGFGRFFYQAILNRDYNVVLFSAFAGSFLTLIGYLLADISYTLLDPRVRFK